MDDSSNVSNLIQFLPSQSQVSYLDLIIRDDLSGLMLKVISNYLLGISIPFLKSFGRFDSHLFLQRVLYHLTFYKEYNLEPISHMTEKKYYLKAFREKHSRPYPQMYPYIILLLKVYYHHLNHPIHLFKQNLLHQSLSIEHLNKVVYINTILR